jgi:hypothetical protein
MKDLLISEYQRYGSDWDADVLRKWVGKLLGCIDSYQADINDLKLEVYALEQEVDEVIEALQDAEDEGERLRNLIVDLRRGH